MEDIKQSTVNSDQSTVNQTSLSTVHRSPNSFLVILLSSLLIISCLIAGFFAYQTQNLVKELTKLQVTPTPIATTEPDPTANWKTYVDLESKFEFKYPKNLYLVNKKPNKDTNTDGQVLLCTNQLQEIKGGNYLTLCGAGMQILSFDYSGTWGGGCGSPGVGEKIHIDNKEVDACSTDNSFGFYTNNIHYKIPYSISFRYGQTINRNIVNQILSTFKFIEPAASSSPIACTMDAKICPDGSAVGRSGPKCEFEACPTPKP